MILYKQSPINFVQQQCVALETNDGAMIYLSLNVYNQAVVLNDRWEGAVALLASKMNIPSGREEIIKYFAGNAPEPLTILAPFLGLVQKEVELEKDLEMLCGVLHMMSMTIDFNNYTKVPQEIRANVIFGNRALGQYKQSWADLEMKVKVSDVDLDSIPLDVVKTLIREIVPELAPVSYAPVQQVAVSTGHTDYVVSSTDMQSLQVEEEVEEEEDDDDLWAKLNAAMASMDDSSSTTSKVEEVVEEPVVEESSADEDEEAKKIDEIMKLMGKPPVGGA